MCKILRFPALKSDPEPPGPTARMPRPVEPTVTNATSIHLVSVSASQPAIPRVPVCISRKIA